MRIEINWCMLDEISIGMHMYYGTDPIGDFHSIHFGFLFMEVSIYNYIQDV